MGIDTWIDGGWWVDILLWEETRKHSDLDIVVQEKDLWILSHYLRSRGFWDVLRDDTCDWNFVLWDDKGNLIDIHAVVFDEYWNGIYWPRENWINYPAQAFTGIWTISGMTFMCISPEDQVASHQWYPLRDSDYHDVSLLCSRFYIQLPIEYRKNRITFLKKLVRDFYESHRDTWIPVWTEYLYTNHIFFVAELSQRLSEEFGIDPEYSMAAALLHDIADALVDRTHPDHMKISEKIALELLSQSGFSSEEIEVIIYDIIAKHACRNGVTPSTREGQIMTSADAIFHLVSDFWQFAITQKLKKGDTKESIRKWWLEKVDRDFHVKICFDELRERYKVDYQRCKIILEKL